MKITPGTLMIQININCFIVDFQQLDQDNQGAWHSGKAGDWQWTIQDFGMSWGISPTLEQAIVDSNQEMENIRKDFDISDHDIYAMAKPERWCLPIENPCDF